MRDNSQTTPTAAGSKRVAAGVLLIWGGTPAPAALCPRRPPARPPARPAALSPPSPPSPHSLPSPLGAASDAVVAAGPPSPQHGCQAPRRGRGRGRAIRCHPVGQDCRGAGARQYRLGRHHGYQLWGAGHPRRHLVRRRGLYLRRLLFAVLPAVGPPRCPPRTAPHAALQFVRAPLLHRPRSSARLLPCQPDLDRAVCDWSQ